MCPQLHLPHIILRFCVSQPFFATSPTLNTARPHEPELSAGKLYVGRVEGYCISMCKNLVDIATISHQEYVYVKKVDGIYRNDRKPPERRASKMTLSSPSCYCKNEDPFQVQCFLLSELFFLSTFAHWVKCKLFNSLYNLPLCPAKTNNSDFMLGHNLEYLRNYKAAL